MKISQSFVKDNFAILDIAFHNFKPDGSKELFLVLGCSQIFIGKSAPIHHEEDDRIAFRSDEAVGALIIYPGATANIEDKHNSYIKITEDKNKKYGFSWEVIKIQFNELKAYMNNIQDEGVKNMLINICSSKNFECFYCYENKISVLFSTGDNDAYCQVKHDVYVELIHADKFYFGEVTAFKDGKFTREN